METWAQEQQRLPNQSKLADIDISALSLYTPSVGSGDTLDDCKMSIKQPNSAFDSENGIERDLEEVVFCGRSGWYMR